VVGRRRRRHKGEGEGGDGEVEEGMAKTVDWYLANQTWLENVTSGAYRDYYTKQYAGR
jgi:dTDP-D-glucose 4,6-dehydratase